LAGLVDQALHQELGAHALLDEDRLHTLAVERRAELADRSLEGVEFVAGEATDDDGAGTRLGIGPFWDIDLFRLDVVDAQNCSASEKTAHMSPHREIIRHD